MKHVSTTMDSEEVSEAIETIFTIFDQNDDD